VETEKQANYFLSMAKERFRQEGSLLLCHHCLPEADIILWQLEILYL
jgi:hypothetical protein